MTARIKIIKDPKRSIVVINGKEFVLVYQKEDRLGLIDENGEKLVFITKYNKFEKEEN